MIFRVYPSTLQGFHAYDRTTPLACDKVLFDTTGLYDPTKYRFVANKTMEVIFFGNLLWATPPDGGLMTILFFKNGIEECGSDINCHQTNNVIEPNGNVLHCPMLLEAGDYVDLRPCHAFGDPSLLHYLTNSVSVDGKVTCNWFGGAIVG